MARPDSQKDLDNHAFPFIVLLFRRISQPINLPLLMERNSLPKYGLTARFGEGVCSCMTVATAQRVQSEDYESN